MKAKYMVNLAMIKDLGPCEYGYAEFLKYMGGPAKVKRRGDFHIAEIAIHNDIHAMWVIRKLDMDSDTFWDAFHKARRSRKVVEAWAHETAKLLKPRRGKAKR